MTLDLLRRGAAGLGLALTERQYEQFESYYRLLVEWNNRFNLTSVTGYEAVQATHFLDSLSVIQGAPDLADQVIIDVGAGAGFPGLPLKIAFPELQLTLLEATGKKAVFLTEAASALGLGDVAVLNVRAEDAARQPDHRGKYAIVVSRAVASLDTLSELCLPFCRVGGRFIAMKKGDIDGEIEASKAAVDILGGRLDSIKDVSLAELPGFRKLVIIKKFKPTPPSYPRRSGLPAHNPLRRA